MADKRAYFKVDVGYFTNPKIVDLMAASPMAAILHLESIAYGCQHLTDGKVPRLIVTRMVGAEESDGDLLVERGHWIDLGSGQIEVHDFLEHQRSAADAKKASDAGRKGAQSRWQSDSDTDGNADRMRNPMPREKEREKEREERRASRRSPETAIPQDWQPSDSHRSFAADKRIDLEREAFKFRNHALANDRRQRNWNAAFTTWLAKAEEFAPTNAKRNPNLPEGW